MILNINSFLNSLVYFIPIFTIGFLLFCKILLFIAKRRYNACTEPIKGQFVKWHTITANPKANKKYYYPVFKYKYKGQIYENHALGGWTREIPVLYQRQYPIWINPKKPNLIAVHKEEYNNLQFQKV